MTKFYRITTDTDAVHWYAGASEEDARQEHYDIHDPYGTDIADARIYSMREGTKSECAAECFDEQRTLWATCWCEDEFLLQPGGEDWDELDHFSHRHHEHCQVCERMTIHEDKECQSCGFQGVYLVEPKKTSWWQVLGITLLMLACISMFMGYYHDGVLYGGYFWKFSLWLSGWLGWY